MATCWRPNCTNEADTNCDDCGHPICSECLATIRQGKKDRAQPPKKCKTADGTIINVYELHEEIPE